MKVHVITFGCRSNQCDARWLEESLAKAGCEIVGDVYQADALIVNTCTVTAEGERQGKQAIRRCRRENPHAVIIATGCAVQAQPAVFLGMPEVDYVVNLDGRSRLADLINTFSLRTAPTLVQSPDEPRNCFFAEPSERHVEGVARVPLKIQDGCDNQCTYCIVWKVRGKPRSMPPEEVMRHIEALGKAGHKEVVLTGIHLGAWGKDLMPPRSLESLLRRILMRGYVERIRISSIDPSEITGELLDLLVSEDGLCPHLHLPLQSASDEILQAMGRKYKFHDAEVRIRLLKQAAPHAAVGLDVIVGFPGETDEQFESGFRNLEGLPFDYLHVFPFSPRPGTPAAEMEDRPDSSVVRSRANRLHKLSAKRRKKFWESFIGTIRPVIVESQTADGRWFGHTDNYIPVFIKSRSVKIGDLVPVGLYEIEEGGIQGEVSR